MKYINHIVIFFYQVMSVLTPTTGEWTVLSHKTPQWVTWDLTWVSESSFFKISKPSLKSKSQVKTEILAQVWLETFRELRPWSAVQPSSGLLRWLCNRCSGDLTSAALIAQKSGSGSTGWWIHWVLLPLGLEWLTATSARILTDLTSPSMNPVWARQADLIGPTKSLYRSRTWSAVQQISNLLWVACKM